MVDIVAGRDTSFDDRVTFFFEENAFADFKTFSNSFPDLVFVPVVGLNSVADSGLAKRLNFTLLMEVKGSPITEHKDTSCFPRLESRTLLYQYQFVKTPFLDI